MKATTFITPAAYEDDEADAAEDVYRQAFNTEPKPARSSPMVDPARSSTREARTAVRALAASSTKAQQLGRHRCNGGSDGQP